MQKLNYLDLFSGIGGFHLGLKWAGFEFNKVFYSDIEEYANKVYKKNFPDAILLGDITKINPNELPKIDIITGGFPCQDISSAGHKKGLIDANGNKTRSGLFYEIIRLCRVLRPKVLLLENVANILVLEKGRVFAEVLRCINEIGYDAEWEIISACSIGAPHTRERMFITSYPNKNSNFYIKRKEKKTKIEKQECWRGFTCTKITGDTEPVIIRKNDGISKELDRIGALGNSVVPQVVQLIGELIKESGILKERCPKKEEIRKF
jgi:DNA (cytosine-5)-methyltransferase 1